MRKLWTCPKCGRDLQIANQEHVCGLYDLDAHFVNRDPLGHDAFGWMCAHLDPLGIYNILPMKTLIAFANGVNFAFLKTKKRGVELSLVLDPALDNPRLQLVTRYSRTKSIFRTQIADHGDLDKEMSDLLVAAYQKTEPG